MIVPRNPALGNPSPSAHTPDWATAGSPYPQLTGPFADQVLWTRVIKQARCADGTHDPEQWFPVNAEIDKARQEAAAAIAVCTSCPVRAQCLALSLRHWDIGQHGVWGGLVAAERAALRPIVRAHMARHAPHLPLMPGVDTDPAARAAPGGRTRNRPGGRLIAVTAAAAGPRPDGLLLDG